MLVDSPFTAFARSTFGALLVCSAAVTALVAMLVWVRRSQRRDRRLAAAASLIGASFAIALNVILGGLGVWQSTLYTLPLSVLASMLPLLTLLVLLVLSGYRWLSDAAATRRSSTAFSSSWS
jgi:hypothetical protein